MLSKAPVALALALSGTFWTGSLATGGAAGPLTTVRVASGLDHPIFVTHAPGDSTRLFIVEQRGVIKILDLVDGSVLATPFLHIDSLVPSVSGNSDPGLLGLAFHPNYSTNGLFYVNFVDNASTTVIRRYGVSSDPNLADPASGLTLLELSQPQANHNGGWLGFSPNDGYLYIPLGDGGNGNDTGPGHTAGTGNAQDITDNLYGARISAIRPISTVTTWSMCSTCS